METITFDTHKFIKRLTEHGFTEEQAEVLADEQVNLINSNLASKADIEELKAASKADIEALKAASKADIEELKAASKADIAKVIHAIEELKAASKADIEATKVELLKWTFAAMIAQGGLIVALIKLL